jgi:predicted phosphodiesterase
MNPFNDLGDEPILWLKSLPFDHQLNDEIYMCHGSPTDDLKYLLENIKGGLPCLRSDSEIKESLDGQSSNIIFCGHAHIPRSIKISSGQLIINPGSVGLPAYTDDEPIIHSMENYCPHASYAVIEKNAAGWIIQQIKVPYDYKKAVEVAKARQREDWGHFLTTGRGL